MDASEVSGQYHFDPATYLDMVRAEVPAYDRLQDAVAAASGTPCRAILDLGTGTGETAARVLARHPEATLVGVDESGEMLAVARRLIPHADLVVSRLQDPLPPGPFDLVISALAVHHLHDREKAHLFARVRAALRPSGRFVLGDLVRPADPADVVTPIDGEHDKPGSLEDQVEWLGGLGFAVEVSWSQRDLAVLTAVAPG